jgi:short-subunit dehydrogenase
LITGASSGIGAALAHALAARGHAVTLVARRRERLEELAAGLRDRHGTRADVLCHDLAAHSGRDDLAAALDDLGLIVEVLCNNAGFGSAAPFVRLDRERELEMLALNCQTVVDLCARYTPGMVDRGRGAILNVASTAAFQPLPGQSTYAASKALVLSFTEALHQELGGTGVAVSALCPGPVRTEFTHVAGIEDVERTTPSFLWSTAESVAEAGVRGLEANHRVVIPGAINRITALAGQHTPRAMLLRAVAQFYPAGRDRDG